MSAAEGKVDRCRLYLFQADNAQALSIFLSSPKYIRHIGLPSELSILWQKAVAFCSAHWQM